MNFITFSATNKVITFCCIGRSINGTYIVQKLNKKTNIIKLFEAALLKIR